jgi:SEN1 N terminal
VNVFGGWRKLRLARDIRENMQCTLLYYTDGDHRFFGAFTEETLTTFWADFNSWQLEMVRTTLKNAKLIPNTSSRTLNDVPLPIVYQIFTNLDILTNPDIFSIIHSSMPSMPTVTLPIDPLPPGILLLAFDEDEKSRIWARSHLKASNILTNDQLTGPYFRVLESIVGAVSVKRDTDISFLFSSDLSVLWSGVSHVLRILPSEYFMTAKARQLEIHRLVFGHLHDHGPRQWLFYPCLSTLLTKAMPFTSHLHNSLFPSIE